MTTTTRSMTGRASTVRAAARGAPSYSETLPCAEESAGAARVLVRVVLATWGLGCLADDAELIVSELVTNALRYARPHPIRVVISRPAPDAVQIRVSDRNPRAVPVAAAAPDAEYGRGLAVVDALAVRRTIDYRKWGKSITATLAVPAETGA
jgi:serine/threonine-protein kinase RsbW